MRLTPAHRARAVLAIVAVSSIPAWLSGCADDDRRHPHALGTYDKQPPPAITPVRFEFHEALLMNLHHFLYDAARHPERLEQAHWAAPPSPQELAALQAAVAFYAQHYAKRDLLFDADMVAIKHALSVRDDALAAPAGLALPPELAATLGAAVPAYTRVLWPVHRQADELWVNNVSTLNARYGEEIQSRLEHALSHKFPASIRVDVVYDTGTFQGGYTDEPPPQSVLPSSRPTYNGEASLEMLWHEASHAGVTDTLEKAIADDIQSLHRAPADELWHATQFYTVGYVVQDVYRYAASLDYVPYATKSGLYARAWPSYQLLLDTDWSAWLQGRGTMRQAVTRMVERLPPA